MFSLCCQMWYHSVDLTQTKSWYWPQFRDFWHQLGQSNPTGRNSVTTKVSTAQQAILSSKLFVNEQTRHMLLNIMITNLLFKKTMQTFNRIWNLQLKPLVSLSLTFVVTKLSVTWTTTSHPLNAQYCQAPGKFLLKTFKFSPDWCFIQKQSKASVFSHEHKYVKHWPGFESSTGGLPCRRSTNWAAKDSLSYTRNVTTEWTTNSKFKYCGVFDNKSFPYTT